MDAYLVDSVSKHHRSAEERRRVFAELVLASRGADADRLDRAICVAETDVTAAEATGTEYQAN